MDLLFCSTCIQVKGTFLIDTRTFCLSIIEVVSKDGYNILLFLDLRTCTRAIKLTSSVVRLLFTGFVLSRVDVQMRDTDAQRVGCGCQP